MEKNVYWQINETEYVTVQESTDLFRTMTKALYDEQQKAVTNGNN